VVGRFDGERLSCEEVHRFDNVPVRVSDVVHWTFSGCMPTWSPGIEQAGSVDSVAIDAWAWTSDCSTATATCWRTRCTTAMRGPMACSSWLTGWLDGRGSSTRPGSVFADQHAVQLLSMRGSPLLAAAHTLLTIPDLLAYWLFWGCGVRIPAMPRRRSAMTRGGAGGHGAAGCARDTHADLSQRRWAGTKLGSYRGIEVIAPAAHDTACAVAGNTACRR